MKKPTKSQESSAEASGCPDAGLLRQVPRIVEYLTTTAWEDKSPREPSSLAISIKDGLIQLALNDKAVKRSIYTSAGSLAEALGLMEDVLGSETPPWRSWKSGKGK